jgi:hypothetical protein
MLWGCTMNAQQLLDYIIKPTLEYMEGNYNSKNAQMLLLATAAIESKCGYYIKQINGPALGIWQMEPATYHDIMLNCDALKCGYVGMHIHKLRGVWNTEPLIVSPMYACAMARLKYSMDTAPLPFYGDIYAIYAYYKRIYNTPLGASTFEKFKAAWNECGLDDVIL